MTQQPNSHEQFRWTGRRIALLLGPSAGGIGRHVAALSAAIEARGARPVVLAPAGVIDAFPFAGQRQPLPAGERPRVRLPLGYCGRERGSGGYRSLLAGCDLVHGHGLRAAAACALAVPRGVPLIATWHNAVLGRTARWRAAPAERLVARRAQISFCVSPDLLARVFALGGRPQLCPVGAAAPLSTGPDSSISLRAGLDDARRAVVVCVARLHRQKGLDVLIEAAAKVAAHPRRPLVLVAGDGPERAALDRQVRARRAPVRLLGARDDVPALLRAADLAVLPSRWEGSPLAAHEALQAGTPLIATRVGGLPALVGDAALLVPPDDPDTLAAAIRELLDHPARAAGLGARGRRRATEWPDAGASAAAVLAGYRSVLLRRSATW